MSNCKALELKPIIKAMPIKMGTSIHSVLHAYNTFIRPSFKCIEFKRKKRRRTPALNTRVNILELQKIPLLNKNKHCCTSFYVYTIHTSIVHDTSISNNQFNYARTNLTNVRNWMQANAE